MIVFNEISLFFELMELDLTSKEIQKYTNFKLWFDKTWNIPAIKKKDKEMKAQLQITLEKVRK